MIAMPELKGVFVKPSLMFTLKGNSRSEAVLAALQKIGCAADTKVFDTEDEIKRHFGRNGASPAAAVVLFDDELRTKRFHPTCRNRSQEVKSPSWTQGTQWIVVVGNKFNEKKFAEQAEGCARQLKADFGKNFSSQLAQGQFPWGMGRKLSGGDWEQPPLPVQIPKSIVQTIAGLNEGPDLAQAVADKAFAVELPKGSKISWIRVLPEPLNFDTSMLGKVLASLRSFETACNQLVYADPEVQKLLLAGVDLPRDSELSRAYLFPNVLGFSVGRPDLHYTQQGALPFASEIDEMPGGMPELVHIDKVYGINQARWEKAFDWLCGQGRLLFLVSHDWSKCYIPETAWLVAHLKELGYPVDLLTTDRLEELQITPDAVYFDGEKIGTIWRQFPIFETRGRLAEVVLAAQQGAVRLIPEFAHFGNKSWFSVFRSHNEFYRQVLAQEALDILDQVLPHSYIVEADDGQGFPINVDGVEISSLANLKHLSQQARDRLVLKVCGANNKAARSYGVLMGLGIKQPEWEEWVDKRLALKQPFVIQRRLEAGVGRIPVMNTKTGLPELFSCRILARPWSFDGELVSVHGCAVPSKLYRVHGMVDMAVVPFTI